MKALSEPSICDVFVKLGGSILDNPAYTPELIPVFAALSKRYRMVVMTGGGRLAKQIGANQRKLGSEFFPSWRAGILCLDVNAGLLASHTSDFAVATSVFEIMDRLANGKMPVLAPAAKIVNDLVLLPDYKVTTDSYGLYFANLLGAKRYVVVSNVDGVYDVPPGKDEAEGHLLRSLKPEEMEALTSSKLDPAFPAYFRRYPLPTTVVNGKYPARVSDAIQGQPTIGTTILPDNTEERLCARTNLPWC